MLQVKRNTLVTAVLRQGVISCFVPADGACCDAENRERDPHDPHRFRSKSYDSGLT